jgi:two-component system sensor histidine kinase YesM
MGNKKKNYLSTRLIIWLMFLVILLILIGIFYLYCIIEYGIPVWPGIAMLAMALVLLCTGYLNIVKPYMHTERRVKLFLDGYTLQPEESNYNLDFITINGMLLQRVQEIMNSTQVWNLNKRQAQYLALQNQINPHFLYNTLEGIRSEAMLAGLTQVAEMTEALATFFRYTISKVENLVSVEEELQNCETYFQIQQYRFGSRLELKIEYNPEDRDDIFSCRLPKLTMQPILENSIIHGTECKIGTGHLTIHLERTKQRLAIRISDDGIGMDENNLILMNERLARSGKALMEQNSDTRGRGGIALINVNNRIHLLFGEEYGIHVYSILGTGTDVEISLPAITSDREIKNKEALR